MINCGRNVRLAAIATLLVALIACSRKGEEVALVPAEENTAPTTTAEPMQSAAHVNEVDSLKFAAATDRYSSQNGELLGSMLGNNGKAGYLLFGPYVAFKPGIYTIAINGRIESLPPGSKVRLDVVSKKGTVVHGKLDIDTAGVLPSYDVVVDAGVTDLEVRVQTPQDSKVFVESYSVAAKG